MNPLRNWVETDMKLQGLLNEIQQASDSVAQQASIAFHKLCEVYDLPKYPEDIARYEARYDALGIEMPTCVYQELGMAKFLSPKEDPRGLVLQAVWNVKNHKSIDPELLLKKHFKRAQRPHHIQIGFKGDDTDVSVIFLKEGENWWDMGCKAAIHVR